MTLPEFDLVVHATHEAGLKVGGIGAVLDGLLAQPAYNRAVKRTILVGPLDAWNPLEMERLYAPRNGFKVRYSGHDGIYNVAEDLARALTQVELGYSVRLLYGTRKFGEFEHEVLLVDAHAVNPQATHDFKFHLYERYGINSYHYQSYAEYEEYIRAAEPSFAALQALITQSPNHLGDFPPIIIAHEWLGLPLAFCAKRHHPARYRTVFYAHETATVRLLVENHAGHDTRFYNALYAARDYGLYLEDVFGDQRAYFKHALINAAASLDGVFAVGDLVVDELRFLSPAFAARPIALVYNGAPASSVSLAEHWHSKQKLQQYAINLFGFRPSWVFTHVTRMVLSKGMWRDLRVMEQLDQQLTARGETVVLIALSSSIPAGRHGEDVWRWEAEYGWPVHHRGGNGDLDGLEGDYFRASERFNRTARASRIVLVNQFGFSRDRCGLRMPADMEFNDIRHGSDLEFGQSIYEPFGIGQVEPLSSGAICCPSNICGCVGFISQASGLSLPNVVLADYVTLPVQFRGLGLRQLLNIGQSDRDIVEANEARRVAHKIVARLPRDEAAAQRLLEDGYALSQHMSWQRVVEDGLLPALETVVSHQ